MKANQSVDYKLQYLRSLWIKNKPLRRYIEEVANSVKRGSCKLATEDLLDHIYEVQRDHEEYLSEQAAENAWLRAAESAGEIEYHRHYGCEAW